MMSFGGGWFFVAQSEAITVMNRDIKLPGLGSYMAQAIQNGDSTASLWAVVAMIVLILVSDQLVWRPLLAWADKFKIELTESQTPATSWVYNLPRGAYVLTWLGEYVVEPSLERTWRLGRRQARRLAPLKVVRGDHVWRAVIGVLLLWLAYEVLTGIVAAAEELRGALSWPLFGHIAWLGFLTMLRVIAMTVLATLVWTPIGVWIGFQPRVARFAQPLAQIGASFPVSMTFPLAQIPGLLEILSGASEPSSIYEISDEVGKEFGETISILKATEILDLIDTPKHDVELTDLGRRCVAADREGRRKIFADQVFTLRIFHIIIALLNEYDEIDADRIVRDIASALPYDSPEKTFETMIAGAATPA